MHWILHSIIKPLIRSLIRVQPAFAAVFLAILVTFGWQRGEAIAADKAPNIVWLVQDHVPWRQVTAGGGPKPVLPTLQRLIGDSVVFQQARTVTPLCAPARATMMTGAYPHNHGVTTNDSIRERSTFYPEYRSFNQYLQSKGYVAGYFGKWHAGTVNAGQLGFDGFAPTGYGDPYTTPTYAQYLKDNGLPKPSVDLEWQVSTPVFGSPSKKIAPTSNGGMAGILTTPVETHESHFLASMASDWIDKRAASGDDKPFVLRVDTWGPHQPYFVAEPFVNKINPSDIPEYPNFSNTFTDRPDYQQKRRNFHRSRMGMTDWADWQPLMARIYENFSQTDAAFLRVLDALERNGLTENTIIIYTADHGDIAGSGGGLFDKDAFMTEEVMSIPLVIKWPGVTDGGHTSDAFVSNLDIVPTVLEMAGVTPPAQMDGKSLAPLLKNPDSAQRRESYMAEHHGHLETKVFQRALYHENYKYVAHLDDKHELYDLAADPFEMINRIDDPAMQAVLGDMKSRLVAEMLASNDDSEDTKRLVEQMGGDYASVAYLGQETRISMLRDTYTIDLPYGVNAVPDLQIRTLPDTADVRVRGKRLEYRVRPAASLPGESVVEAYDEAGTLIHTARLQLRVNKAPNISVTLGEAVLAGAAGSASVRGAVPLSVTSASPAEVFTNVEVSVVPVLASESIAFEASTLYEGASLPGALSFDSLQLGDGAYDLQIKLTTKGGAAFSQAHRLLVDNWNELVDDLESSQVSGWFGTVKRRKTVEESDGWESVTESAAALLGDVNRLVSKGSAPQFLTWELEGLRRFRLVIYTQDVLALRESLTLMVSQDKQTWQAAPFTQTETDAPVPGWHVVTLSGDLEQVPVRYLRVDVAGEKQADLQLGQMELLSTKGAQD